MTEVEDLELVDPTSWRNLHSWKVALIVTALVLAVSLAIMAPALI